MQGRLQQTYRVARELDRHALYNGQILLSQMPRLGSLVIANDARVDVRFEFERTSFQQAAIKGHYKTALTVECQRCLEPMVETIEQDFILLIDADEADIQAFQVDSVMTEEGYLDVFEVIEDELILALPLITMHEDIHCNKYLQSVSADEPVVERDNPFSVLKALKGND